MIINDIWFDLKDGRKALLRSPKEEDAVRRPFLMSECSLIAEILLAYFDVI